MRKGNKSAFFLWHFLFYQRAEMDSQKTKKYLAKFYFYKNYLYQYKTKNFMNQIS